MVQLILKSNNTGVWESLDCGADLTISLTKSFEEIEDFQTRKSTFSKTFNIPRTEKNNKFFINSFQVNSSGFNDDIVVDAVVKYGGADVFNGSCRLNKVYTDLTGGYYELFLTQNLPDLSTILQEVKLVDLDFSGLTHVLNYQNVSSTWTYSGGSYENYTGITGSIVYPLAHYGYTDETYYSTFDTSPSGFTNSSYPLAMTQFAPWVNTKLIVDEMFRKADFTYTSSFFNSDYFMGIFALAKTNDTAGVKLASGATSNANIFRASDRSRFNDIADGNFDENYFKGFILRVVENNPLNIFSPSLSFQNRGQFFTTAVSGLYRFKFGMSLSIRDNIAPVVYLNCAIKDVDSGTIYNQIKGLAVIQGQPTDFGDIYINATIPAGRRVALFYSRQNGAGDPLSTIVFHSSYLELYSSPVLTNDPNVLLQTNLPAEMSCIDFLKGIISLFNLVVIPNGERSVLIERWDDYFSTGQKLNWSQKLDLSKGFSIEPTTDLTKEYIIKYKDSDDRLSLLNIQQREISFGGVKVVSNAQFHTGTKVIEIPFEPLPITTFDAITESNILIPHIYTWNKGGTTNPTQFTPFGSLIRLGFYNGMMDCKITGTTTPIYYLSGITSVSATTYPAISHLSSYEYTQSTFSDLNIRNQYDFWQGINDTYIGYTENDILNNFWDTRVSQLYETDIKIFNGTFKLTPNEINNLSFNDKVYFQNAWWRLLEMTDADITNDTLVSCKFIQLPYFTDEATTLIPPTYSQALDPNPSSPTGSTYQHIVYSSNNALEMCSETSGQIVVYSNCSILSAGCSVFSDTGAVNPINEGILIKVIGGNTIYQVIEQGILINFQNC